MSIKELLDSQTFHNTSMTIFTLCLVVFSFLTWLTIERQTTISEELKDIQVYQDLQQQRIEQQKIIKERKKLKLIVDNILGLFSGRPLIERKSYSRADNIKLANIFYHNLYLGLDNYLIANDKESLKLWLHSMNQTFMFADEYNKTISTDNLADDIFTDIFVTMISSAWQDVFKVHLKLNYTDASSMLKKYKDLFDSAKSGEETK